MNFSSPPKDKSKWDLVLSTKSVDDRHKLFIDRMVISRLQSFFQSFGFLAIDSYVSKNQGRHYLNVYARAIDFSLSSLLMAFPQQVHAFRTVIDDLTSGETFNFVPEICKQPEDSSRPPTIDKNGAGLASTLYRLARGVGRKPVVYSRSQGIQIDQNKSLMARISKYVSLASDAIAGVDTQKNPFDNKISIFVEINSGSKNVSFPLAHCSDGTVKWIALISTLLTNRSGFAIEEPENFLHPNIQKEFLNVVRSEASVSPTAFTLLTTHSESLLDEASPDELMLVWMENGKTIAKRIGNASDLKAEINATGFGLGHYYITEAFDVG
jgi:predicted ATPase